MHERSNSRRWRSAALIAAGVAVGVTVIATPAGAHFKPSIAHLWSHIKPKADQRYVPAQTAVKRGMSFKGNWAIINVKTGVTGSRAASAISFARPLPANPTAHYIADGATPPTECPGTVANPRALPGHLCVYEGDTSFNIAFRDICDPIAGGCTRANRYGAYVEIWGSADGTFYANGTWAVTAS